MEWTSDIDLLLFDFDGLLVDTEPFYFSVFKQVCARHGFPIEWDFEHYCHVAHTSPTGLKDAFCEKHPHFNPEEWSQLYQEHSPLIKEIFLKQQIPLMPGVAQLLKHIHKNHINHCVVTLSSRSHVEILKAKHPVLSTIPYWITRENFSQSKPNPECYLKAIHLYAPKENARIIGFEDSTRGLKALLQTSAHPVLIRNTFPQALQEIPRKKFSYFSSFESIGPNDLFITPETE